MDTIRFAGKVRPCERDPRHACSRARANLGRQGIVAPPQTDRRSSVCSPRERSDCQQHFFWFFLFCVVVFRLRFGRQELVPIVIGGMGEDISTAELALEVVCLGGIGHISDAMVQTVSDRRFDTKFVSEKLKKYKTNAANSDKSNVHFNLAVLEEATRYHVGRTMDAKRGNGMIFINCMEKLTMNAPRETLRMRLSAALDAGIDGITLSAGLHLGSFALIEDHPRFRDAKLGIIVSSPRALAMFLRKNARLQRLPDYIVVEGPLAGGHLGFGIEDWV